MRSIYIYMYIYIYIYICICLCFIYMRICMFMYRDVYLDVPMSRARGLPKWLEQELSGPRYTGGI